MLASSKGDGKPRLKLLTFIKKIPVRTRGSRGRTSGRRRAPNVLLVGNPNEVAAKITRHNEAPGAISRGTCQMNVAGLPRKRHLRTTEFIGTSVAPLLHWG
jgi:hypothetical protein